MMIERGSACLMRAELICPSFLSQNHLERTAFSPYRSSRSSDAAPVLGLDTADHERVGGRGWDRVAPEVRAGSEPTDAAKWRFTRFATVPPAQYALVSPCHSRCGMESSARVPASQIRCQTNQFGSPLCELSARRGATSAPRHNDEVVSRQAKPFRDPFQRPQRQIPLASLEPAHVGSVHAEDLSELLLAEAAFFPDPPEVSPHGALQVAFGHSFEVPELLLEGLQTYK
jgi:hypothetical protein